MIITHKGHTYFLEHVGGSGTTQIQFRNTEPGHECEGVTTQEILRMLIDRTKYCNNCLPHPVNAEIIDCFRKAIALHEARALIRAVEKDGYEIEKATIASNGHIALTRAPQTRFEVLDLKPATTLLANGQAPVYGGE